MKKEYPKLPKAFKNKWIKALRSGDYKQGEDLLKAQQYTEDGIKIKGEYKYCCLGVAGDICGASVGDRAYLIKGMRGLSKIPEAIRGDEAP